MPMPSASAASTIQAGQTLTGPLFAEPMRVETVQPQGVDAWQVGLVGARSDRFHRVVLADDAGAAKTIGATPRRKEAEALRGGWSVRQLHRPAVFNQRSAA